VCNVFSSIALFVFTSSGLVFWPSAVVGFPLESLTIVFGSVFPFKFSVSLISSTLGLTFSFSLISTFELSIGIETGTYGASEILVSLSSYGINLWIISSTSFDSCS